MSTVSEERRNARAGILARLIELLEHAPIPSNEVERAQRLDDWEAVGNAVRELLAAEDLAAEKWATLLQTRDDAIAALRISRAGGDIDGTSEVEAHSEALHHVGPVGP